MQIGTVMTTRLICDFCGGNHHNRECEAPSFSQELQEQVNYMGNPRPNDNP